MEFMCSIFGVSSHVVTDTVAHCCTATQRGTSSACPHCCSQIHDVDELSDDSYCIRGMCSSNSLGYPPLAEKAAGIESASARSTKAPDCRQSVRYAEDEDLGNSFRMGEDIR